VTATVTNTGSRDGDQVLQLYYHFSNAHVIRPNTQLIAFRRVHLKAGQSASVTFRVEAAALGYYNEDMRYCVEPGAAELRLGVSALDIVDEKRITLTGKTVDLMGRRRYRLDSTVR